MPAYKSKCNKQSLKYPASLNDNRDLSGSFAAQQRACASWLCETG